MKTIAWGGLMVFLIQIGLYSALHLEFGFAPLSAMAAIFVGQSTLAVFVTRIVQGGTAGWRPNAFERGFIFVNVLPGILAALLINALRTGDPYKTDDDDDPLLVDIFIALCFPSLLFCGIILKRHTSPINAFYWGFGLWCAQYLVAVVSSEIKIWRRFHKIVNSTS